MSHKTSSALADFEDSDLFPPDIDDDEGYLVEEEDDASHSIHKDEYSDPPPATPQTEVHLLVKRTLANIAQLHLLVGQGTLALDEYALSYLATAYHQMSAFMLAVGAGPEPDADAEPPSEQYTLELEDDELLDELAPAVPPSPLPATLPLPHLRAPSPAPQLLTQRREASLRPRLKRARSSAPPPRKERSKERRSSRERKSRERRKDGSKERSKERRERPPKERAVPPLPPEPTWPRESSDFATTLTFDSGDNESDFRQLLGLVETAPPPSLPSRPERKRRRVANDPRGGYGQWKNRPYFAHELHTPLTTLTGEFDTRPAAPHPERPAVDGLTTLLLVAAQQPEISTHPTLLHA